MDIGDNVWDVDWPEPDAGDETAAQAGFAGVRGKRLRRQLGAVLSAAVYELEPAARSRPTTSITAARSC